MFLNGHWVIYEGPIDIGPLPTLYGLDPLSAVDARAEEVYIGEIWPSLNKSWQRPAVMEDWGAPSRPPVPWDPPSMAQIEEFVLAFLSGAQFEFLIKLRHRSDQTMLLGSTRRASIRIDPINYPILKRIARIDTRRCLQSIRESPMIKQGIRNLVSDYYIKKNGAEIYTELTPIGVGVEDTTPIVFPGLVEAFVTEDPGTDGWNAVWVQNGLTGGGRRTYAINGWSKCLHSNSCVGQKWIKRGLARVSLETIKP
jgi:hypothetical protein